MTQKGKEKAKTMKSITCCRTISSTSMAVTRLCGRGIPWVMIVDSSATTGRLFAKASSTSGLISTMDCLQTEQKGGGKVSLLSRVVQLMKAKVLWPHMHDSIYLKRLKSTKHRLWADDTVDNWSKRWNMLGSGLSSFLVQVFPVNFL